MNLWLGNDRTRGFLK